MADSAADLAAQLAAAKEQLEKKDREIEILQDALRFEREEYVELKKKLERYERETGLGRGAEGGGVEEARGVLGGCG